MLKSTIISFLFVLIHLLSFSQNSRSNGIEKTISLDELKDKIAGAWIGQMVGNIYGLPHENKYIANPGPENWPYGYTKNLDKLKNYDGAFSDDDTDVEYMYLLTMQKYGPEPSYEQLREAWMYYIRDRVWLANRGALGLMHFGYTPPYTGAKDLNPHWYQIDPQLINEIWAYTAPGMVKYSAQKSDFAAHITSDDWGVEPTIMYGAMYSAAFFEKDMMKLINIGLAELPANGRYAATVKKMISLHNKYPENWQKARQEMADEFYTNEPDMTRTIWNANLNGACGILAMLYGEGDFQKTLDLSCAMGFDADNQAATVAGLLGVMYGFKALPKNLYLPIEGWTLPFNDRYINITRYDLPDASIQEMINNTVTECIDLIKSKGGKVTGKPGSEKVTINTNVAFTPPLEFYIGPSPRMEVNIPVDYTFYSEGNKNFDWKIIGGELPEGLIFTKGHLTGTPRRSGTFKVVIELSNKSQKISREFNLLVRNKNIAAEADTIYANVRKLNEEVLDSCWYTFGKSMYAKNVDVIRDGKLNGPGSVFYSLAAKANIPKVDYYGYGWETEKEIDMMALHIGCMEEFGGWFTSLNVQYQNEEGKWLPVENVSVNPPLPETDIVFFQPHFVEYVLSFNPVKTRAIRVIGDAMVQSHWNKYTKNVSAFTSVTELSVYESTKR
ncbi:MAG: ADP-ribosylglycohydrolase family protein [Bacteroidales bacterium]|nr:ADP-ribosylglycohydrolase family protein [Bacteroidales bacterium]MCB8999959.1 ADP-ribosylglycohydrolase family protein [Bacteroidales bacterium]MCB9012590.1 ADP-ribosylglycohydrolase family protein [Bacteroidales bacterium]